MTGEFLLAVDQGTSGTKAVVFDLQGRIAARSTCALKSYYPRPGFVEQEPEEIYRSVLEAVRDCLRAFPGNPGAIAACGISNQRETFALWDQGGRPLGRAVVWQCKRSVGVCERLKSAGLEPEINRSTGLIVDPYFSGSKLVWLAENDGAVRNAIRAGAAHFGTIDTWLLYRLTRGRRYATDYTNACRTLLFNLQTLQWDPVLLEKLGLSRLRLPEPQPSAHLFGETDFEGQLSRPVPVASMIGDSHAAAFGEGCFGLGTAKATLGTGSSSLMNTQHRRVKSSHGMINTICWSVPGRVDYALEGIIVSAGASVQWLRDQLGLFADSRETEAMADALPDNGGVYLVPAFAGMGAPHWRMDARAAILGLTFASRREHLARAALEAIAFQVKDVIGAMEQDSGVPLQELKVDGAISANRFVVQLMADLLGTPVVRLQIEEASALGAALLAGLAAGAYGGLEDVQRLELGKRVHEPGPQRGQAAAWYGGWQEALRRAL